MQFLRTAFWVVIAVALAFFCMANYVPVMETKLPVLLIGAFLLGALPFWIMARATRWRLKRRLSNTERALAAMATAPAPAGMTPASEPVPAAPDPGAPPPTLSQDDPLPSTSSSTGPA